MELVNCSICSTSLRLIQINLTEAINICPNVKCVSPFIAGVNQIEIIKRDLVTFNIEEKVKHKNKLIPDLKPCSYDLQTDEYAILDDFFANCKSVEMSEDDIQLVDSEFEAFQQKV